MSKVFIFVIAVCILNVLIFFMLPFKHLLILDQSLFIEQPWRILTYQLYHFSEMHLLENIIGFLLVGFIATELDISLKSFIVVYFASIFIVLPFVFFIFTNDPVAGNSSGIYGALSFTLVKSRKIIPLKISLPIFIPAIFVASLVNLYICGICFMNYLLGEFYHFMGFLTGVLIPFIPIKRDKNILRRNKI